MNYWILLIIFCSCLGGIAQLLLKIGVEPFSIKVLFIGASIYGVAMVLYIFALRNVPLHIGYSLIAFSYLWVMILSWAILREPITTMKMIGSVGIIGSVLLISWG